MPPNVWLVRELITEVDSKREREQDCFVLAASALEAATIVGAIVDEGEHRRIIRIEEACLTPISENKYVVVPRLQGSGLPGTSVGVAPGAAIASGLVTPSKTG